MNSLKVDEWTLAEMYYDIKFKTDQHMLPTIAITYQPHTCEYIGTSKTYRKISKVRLQTFHLSSKKPQKEEIKMFKIKVLNRKHLKAETNNFARLQWTLKWRWLWNQGVWTEEKAITQKERRRRRQISQHNTSSLNVSC